MKNYIQIMKVWKNYKEQNGNLIPFRFRLSLTDVWSFDCSIPIASNIAIPQIINH